MGIVSPSQLISETKSPFESGDNLFKQIFTLQVRTGIIIGKIPALLRTGQMNSTSCPHFIVT